MWTLRTRVLLFLFRSTVTLLYTGPEDLLTKLDNIPFKFQQAIKPAPAGFSSLQSTNPSDSRYCSSNRGVRVLMPSPEPNIQASFFTSVPTPLYHAVLGKQSDLHSQQSWLFSLPVSLMTLLYSYILLYKHCLAIQVCLPCPARDVYLWVSATLILPTCHWFGKWPQYSGFKVLKS